MDLIPEPPDPAPDEAGNSTNLQQRLQIVSTIVTLCVALLAIGLTVWQGYEMRQHNRLTVQPYLKAGSVVNFGNGGVETTYSLESTGLGPAVYSQILVYDRESEAPSEPIRVSGRGNDLIHPMVSPDSFDRFASERGLSSGYTNTPLRHRYVHPTGEEVVFLSVRMGGSTTGSTTDDALETPDDGLFDDRLESAVSALRDSLSTKSYVVCYCSVYGDNCGQVALIGFPPRDDVCREYVDMEPVG
jgi:hypothetical protein